MNVREDEVESSPKKLLIGITGFLETEARPSGVETILFKCLTDVDNFLISRYNWREPIRTLSNFVDRVCNEWYGVEVSIIGYSYGAQSAVNLIKHLCPMPIKNLFLIDPVYRPHHYLPSVFSIYGFGTLYVESTVERCHVWRQKISAIRGCTVVRLGDDTNLYEDTLAWRHTKIDNSPAIQGTIIERMQA